MCSGAREVAGHTRIAILRRRAFQFSASFSSHHALREERDHACDQGFGLQRLGCLDAGVTRRCPIVPRRGTRRSPLPSRLVAPVEGVFVPGGGTQPRGSILAGVVGSTRRTPDSQTTGRADHARLILSSQRGCDIIGVFDVWGANCQVRCALGRGGLVCNDPRGESAESASMLPFAAGPCEVLAESTRRFQTRRCGSRQGSRAVADVPRRPKEIDE